MEPHPVSDEIRKICSLDEAAFGGERGVQEHAARTEEGRHRGEEGSDFPSQRRRGGREVTGEMVGVDRAGDLAHSAQGCVGPPERRGYRRRDPPDRPRTQNLCGTHAGPARHAHQPDRQGDARLQLTSRLQAALTAAPFNHHPLVRRIPWHARYCPTKTREQATTWPVIPSAVAATMTLS